MNRLLSHIPRLAVYSLIILTPLPKASVQPWAITSIHIITLIALTAFLLERALTWDWNWIKTPLDKPIAALLILAILSTLFSVHRRTSFWSLVLLINYIVIFYLAIQTIQTRSQVRQIVYVIIGVATFLGIFGILKRLGMNPFPWWDYGNLRGVRLNATFFNPDHLAGYLEMSLPLLIGLFLTGPAGGKRLLMIYITFMLFLALVLSLSRGGWLGGLTGLTFMGLCLLFDRHFTRKRFVLALVGGSLAAAMIAIASTPVVERILTLTEGGDEPSLSTRIVIWEATTRMVGEYPALGTGPGTYGLTFTNYQPAELVGQLTMAHNDYLHFVSETGVVFVPMAIWSIFVFFRKGFRKLKNPSRLVRGTTVGAMSGIAAMLVHSVLDFNLHIPANALLFIILAALVVSPVPVNYGQSFTPTSQ